MKRLFAGILAMVMSVTMIPGSLMVKVGVKENVKAAVTLQNPRIQADSSMKAGQRVTYDCVWFGSYPQTEIVDKPGTCGTYGKVWGQDSDYEEDSSLYSTLETATGWNSAGDIEISGKKYRRIKQDDTTTYSSGDGNYGWNDPDTYHYFRYDPIKWRILNVSGTRALLLSDKALDDKMYNLILESTTWKTSTLRSWLNGYGSTINNCGMDYSEKNFINTAFSSSERSGILSTTLDNTNSGQYTVTYGGDNTTDKVFILSSYDLFNTEDSFSYGFCKSEGGVHDESRCIKSSTYAKAMGAYTNFTEYIGNCRWWLRSPGNNSEYAATVFTHGDVCTIPEDYVPVNYNGNGICPALTLNLSNSDVYYYAGTLCTNGTEDEVKIPSKYTVSYDANGGSGAPSGQIKTEGTDLILSSTEPTRNDYIFMGWGTSASSTTAVYGKGGTYTNDADITLYAIWEKTITLTYNANGGSGAPTSQSGDMYNSATSCNLEVSSTKPSRSNYIFLGWSTDSNATSASYTGGNSISISEDTNLYAVWQEVPSAGYTVSYNANGGDGAPSPQTKEAGNPIILSRTKPTRNGYEFVGWSTDNTSTGIDYNPEDSYGEDKDLVLYAIWKKTITLSYNANGGNGSPTSQTATIYNSADDYTFTISSISPSRTGYNFQGWGTSSNSETVVYNSGDKITIDSDTMIYALWEKSSEEGGESGGEVPVDPTPQPITKKAQIITASSKTVPINKASFSIGAKSSGNGRLTYKSSNTKAATVSSVGKITVKGYGTAIITITAAETSTYKTAKKSVTVTVVPKKMKLKFVKSKRKGELEIKWVKDKTANSCQIQFSQDWKFNSKKSKVYTKNISKKLNALKKPVTGLTSKKKYYVRIRALKKVDGKTLPGVWSATKEIKIK